MIHILFVLTFALSLLMPQEGHAKDTLTIGISQYPTNLNPLVTTHLASSYVLGFTRTPLVIYNHNWEAECKLCTELPTIENGRIKEVTREDGTKALDIHFTLHQNAKWSDGSRITTKDILFTWEVGKNKETGIASSELFQKNIVGITTKDEKNFILHMDKVSCDAAIIPSFHVLPEHMEHGAFVGSPKNYRDESFYNAFPTTPGLYSGPYVIDSVDVGSRIVLKRNFEWWGEKKAAFETIVLKTIENTTALSANLLAGEIDMISGELGLPLDQALSLEKKLNRQNNNEINVTYKQGLIYEHIDLNLDNPIFKDSNTRKALLHAIDRASISTQLFGGKQTIANTNVNPLDAMYSQNVPEYEYNPTRARELLKDAGWKKGKDGVLVNDAGEKFSFEFMTTAGNQSRELVQQAIQVNWKEIGVDANIQNQPPRVLFGETARKRATDGGVMYAWLSSPGAIPKTTLHSDFIPTVDNNYAGQNYIGYQNPKMDSLLEDLEVKCSTEDQNRLWANLQKLYADDLPALPLYFRSDAFFTPTWLKGLRPTGHQFPSSLWVTDWHVSEE